MGYRLPEERRHMRDLAAQADILVDNGTISRISVPCFYRYGHLVPPHDRMLHDHLGWPAPDSPDHSCQLPPSHHRCHMHVVLDPIDLPGEGYTSVEVSFLDAPSGLEAVGSFDENMVNVTITAMCPEAVEHDVLVPFSVYAVGESTQDEDYPLRDVVTKGLLLVVAGPIETDDTDPDTGKTAVEIANEAMEAAGTASQTAAEAKEAADQAADDATFSVDQLAAMSSKIDQLTLIVNSMTGGSILLMDAGSFGVNVPAGSYADYPITYSTDFNGMTPGVFVALSTGSTATGMGDFQVGTVNESPTGCTIRCWNNGGTGRSPHIRWFAERIIDRQPTP